MEPPELSYIFEEHKLLQLLGKNVWQHLLQLNVSVPYDATILPRGTYSTEDMYCTVTNSTGRNNLKLKIPQMAVTD